VDFLMVHAHPLWNGLRLEDAATWTTAALDSVRAAHPGVPVVLGETGWATRRHVEGEEARLMRGVTAEPEQRTYLRAMTRWSEDSRTVMFFFEAFDENWKGGPHPDAVEKHWGVYRADRTAKLAVQEETGHDPAQR
jgi:exo-beta-1,3-glucanase (GH17 family)